MKYKNYHNKNGIEYDRTQVPIAKAVVAASILNHEGVDRNERRRGFRSGSQTHAGPGL